MEKVNKIKKIEQKVLASLSSNARAPCSFIAKQARASEQRIHYTLQALLKRQVIKGFYALFDYSRFGVLHFRVFMKVGYSNKQKLQDFIDKLIDDPHTFWIANTGGTYDLICTFVAPNPSYFNKHFKALIEQFSEQIVHYSIVTTIVLLHYGRKYFNPKLQEKIIGGDHAIYHFQMDDLKLFSLLADNSRISGLTLASVLGIAPKTVISRIKKFEQLGIIHGYRPLLKLAVFGYKNIVFLIRYHNISVTEEQRLVNILSLHPNVLAVMKLLGEWDLQLDIEVPTMCDFRKLELEIRSQFSSLIKETEMLFVYQEHKKTFFPRFLLEKNK